MSFSFDRVTIGTYNFKFLIENSNPVGVMIAGGLLLFPASLTVTSAKMQFLDQFKINSIAQLINGMFKLLQKLIKYFN